MALNFSSRIRLELNPVSLRGAILCLTLEPLNQVSCDVTIANNGSLYSMTVLVESKVQSSLITVL